jgi:hypothetical protein
MNVRSVDRGLKFLEDETEVRSVTGSKYRRFVIPATVCIGAVAHVAALADAHSQAGGPTSVVGAYEAARVRGAGDAACAILTPHAQRLEAEALATVLGGRVSCSAGIARYGRFIREQAEGSGPIASRARTLLNRRPDVRLERLRGGTAYVSVTNAFGRTSHPVLARIDGRWMITKP